MKATDINDIKKILLIRRDNIDDIVCTTPAIHAVRGKYPDAKIGVLINTYNADAVTNNPDIDEVYVYERVKVWRRNAGHKREQQNLTLPPL